jgi:type II secretory pathway component PulF
MLIDAAGAARLDVALENTAEVVQATKAMKAAVVGGMAYPGFLLAGVGVVLWVFGMKVIPAFDSVKPMEEWTGMAASMAWLSKVIDQAAIPVIDGFLAIMTICMMSLGRWKGPIRIFCDQRVPPWSIYRLFVGSGFLLSLSALIKAGVPVPEALRRLKSAATPWLMERLDTFIYHTNEGQQLGEAMYLSKFQFPDEEIIEDLRLYASLGSFDERMENMAREWISEGVAKVQAQAQMLNMAMMVLVGLCVAWMGAGLLAIQQQVTSL